MTHPALSAPAKVVYFVGWINPRPNHHFGAFLRFIAGEGTYQTHDLGNPTAREEVRKVLEDHCRRIDWRDLENAVSIPGGVSASAPLAFRGVPVILWPAAETLKIMKSPTGHRPGGGAVA